jgi:membrane-bound metal-dependent hydrolase YbcI (DUF457 family)
VLRAAQIVMLFSDHSVAVLGFLLGLSSHTLYDYLFRLKENPDLAFDGDYWIALTASIGTSIIIGMASLACFVPTLPEGSRLYTFSASFAIGFTLEHLINSPKEGGERGKGP